MATTEWQDLLARSGVRDASSSDVIQQLTSISNAGAGAGGSIGVSSIGGSSANAEDAQGGQPDGSSQTLSQQMTSLVTQITTLNSTQQAQVDALQDNTQAVTQSTTSKATTGSSVASTVGSVASSVLGGGLSLSPLISGLISLFGGGGQSTAAPVQYQAGLTGGPGGQIGPVDYGQSGQARPQNQNSNQQVTIQVNAMDSQSFLDHSDDIANAVKAAILNSSSLNDVLLGM
jgi:hypothetical protein